MSWCISNHLKYEILVEVVVLFLNENCVHFYTTLLASRLRLKTIISLIPEPPITDLVDFCAHQGIKMVHIKVDKFVDAVRVTPEQIVKFIEVFKSALHRPDSVAKLQLCTSHTDCHSY